MGVINTVIGLAVILFLSEIVGIHYLLANIGGYAVGLCIGFFLHRNVTFKESAVGSKALEQVKPFLAVFAVAYACQFVFLWFVVDVLGWNNVFSQIVAIGVYTVVGFIGNRYKTFAPVK